MTCKGCSKERDVNAFIPQLRGNGFSAYASCCIGTVVDKRFSDDNDNNQLRYALTIVNALKRRGYTYGSTVQQLGKMLVDQKFKCAICQSKFAPDVKPHLDHDHKTGKARAFLCPKCNMGLGLFEDNPAILNLAIKYILKDRTDQRDIDSSKEYSLAQGFSDV